MAANDKTGSIFVAKDKFSQAANDCGLSEEQSKLLWTKLAESSSQRIIAGATPPREDAANVNQWHWSEMDLAPWCKERLSALLVGIEAEGVPDKGWVRLTSLESCTGEASVSNRKGKRIIAYELNVTVTWKGSVDYDDVEGSLLLPYVSEDVTDGDFEIKWSAKQPNESSHKMALRYMQKQLPIIKERLKTFYDEINAK